jgi:hypothetical protein
LHAVERRGQCAKVVVLNNRQALAIVRCRNTFGAFGEVANWLRDGENPRPTEIGTANTNVNADPITRARTGISLTRLDTAASNAPRTANTNATATTDTFDRAAKVGRERGSESPIPVSPARATRAGRSDDSKML